MIIEKARYDILSDISLGLLMEKSPYIPEGVDYRILTSGIDELKKIERAARVCYDSENKITTDGQSAKELIHKLVDNGHEAMLEHSCLMVRFICDRAIANELTRHRMASFAQESTRYCNYSNGKFGGQIHVICPSDISEGTQEYELWHLAMYSAEKMYLSMLESGCKPEIARSVLPLCLKTTLIVTANYREWRHILELRTNKRAHPDMRNLMLPLLHELQDRIPIIFDDIGKEDHDGGSAQAAPAAGELQTSVPESGE